MGAGGEAACSVYSARAAWRAAANNIKRSRERERRRDDEADPIVTPIAQSQVKSSLYAWLYTPATGIHFKNECIVLGQVYYRIPGKLN